MAAADVLTVSGGGDLGRFYGLTTRHMDAFACAAFQLFQQGRTTEAGAIFQGMLALDRRSPYAYAGLGAVALAQQPPQLEAACAHLRHAAELLPDDPAVHANLGEALLQLAAFDQAAREFEICLKLDPLHLSPAANRARAIIAASARIAAEVRNLAAGGR